MNMPQQSFAGAPASAPAESLPALDRQWAALADAARIIAALAGHDEWSDSGRLPLLLAGAGGDPLGHERARRAVADLAAVLEYGLAALVAVNDQGADPRPAAGALLREYQAAHDAILTLLHPMIADEGQRAG